jgi:hypothetical protein
LIRELLSKLNSAGVEYIVVGGVAARLHGSPLTTDDLDVCCPMDEANMAKLIRAIGGLEPKFRFHPRLPPLPQTAKELSKFRNLNLITTHGKFDVLGEITGIGNYADVAKHLVVLEVEEQPTRVLDLDGLIAAKKAAGREKDKLGVMHLEAVKKRKDSGPGLFDSPK